MPFPDSPAAFDTMLGVPSNRASWQKDFGTLVRDTGSGDLKHPAGYMFHDLPEVDDESNYGDWLISEMDKWGVERGLLPVRFEEDDLGIQLRSIVGVENLMWGSDYPHAESTFPRSRQIVERLLKDVPEDERALIAGGNAARLYHFS